MKKVIIALLVVLFSFGLSGCETTESPEENKIVRVKQELVLESGLNQVKLPTLVDGVQITWVSSEPGVLSENYWTVQQNDDVTTSFTAALTYEGVTITKVFNNIVVNGTYAVNTALVFVTATKDEFTFENMFVYEDVELPLSFNGVAITWSSNDEVSMTNTGAIVRPADGEDNKAVTMTAEFTYQGETTTKEYMFTVASLSVTVGYTAYYNGAGGLSGDVLKAFLHELIDDHTVLSYDDVKYALRDTDEDPNNSNNVILFYTGRSQLKTTFGGGTSDYNREHVWAKSHGDFGNLDGPGSDLHHLRPTDVTVNSKRGNLDFDIGGVYINDYTGSVITSKKDGNSFEPRDEVKGDVARILFYMVVRYEGNDPQFAANVDLELSENVGTSPSPLMGRLSVLLQWHIDDPVDEFEMNRNNVIFGYQGNRNPFIDNPEFVELIWGTPVS